MMEARVKYRLNCARRHCTTQILKRRGSLQATCWVQRAKGRVAGELELRVVYCLCATHINFTAQYSLPHRHFPSNSI